MKISRKVFIFILYTLLLFTTKLAFADEPILVIDPQGHSSMIRDVMFTPDGAILISVSDDKTIRLWDVETGDLIKTIRGQIGAGTEGKLFTGALSSDGESLAVGGYIYDGIYTHIRLFDIESGEQIGLLKGHTNSIADLAFSLDGRWLASSSGDETVRIWDVARQKEIAKLEGHTDIVCNVAFSPDCEKVVSVSDDNAGILWDWRNQKIIKKLEKHSDDANAVAFASNGRYLVSGGDDDKILLWDGNGNFMKEVDTYSGNVYAISFSADSKKIGSKS